MGLFAGLFQLGRRAWPRAVQEGLPLGDGADGLEEFPEDFRVNVLPRPALVGREAVEVFDHVFRQTIRQWLQWLAFLRFHAQIMPYWPGRVT